MGYGYYEMDGYVPRLGWDMRRPAGYYVAALCDVPGCQEPIDRGLAYRCVEQWSTNGGHNEPARGCGAYVCVAHERDHGCVNPFDYDVAVRRARQGMNR